MFIFRSSLIPILAFSALAADLPGSKDPLGMRRYAGSELIGYRAPKFEEFVLPLAPPTSYGPTAYAKSQKIEGLVSRHTYLAPAGRTPAELFRNYKLEFQRLGLTTLYEKGLGEKGWFGPTFEASENEDRTGQILSFNENQERVIVGKTKGVKPAYYYVFVTAYLDGAVPERLEGKVTKDRALAHIVVVAPDELARRMEFVNAGEMTKSLAESGKVALYGIYFDTDKDTLRPESQPSLQEIAKLLKSSPQLKLRIVGHTDNQGTADYNLDLSRRRATGILRELSTRYAIPAQRLEAFGCGLYAPVASNDSEEGRTKNRRVELVKW